jgi:hypothetical protein
VFERIPHVFGGDRGLYVSWKHMLAEKIGVDPCCLVVTGSAGVGFSLSPGKNLKGFDRDSDVDVAVVSAHYFDLAWRAIRGLESKLLFLEPIAQAAIREHREKYIYWGTIATDKILHILPYAKEWMIALGSMGLVPPTEGRQVNARLYRDFDSLRRYQITSIEDLRPSLLT